jgi:murein DD-endopeptidase MepM/ murein hydrolase activator NlpD
MVKIRQTFCFAACVGVGVLSGCGAELGSEALDDAYATAEDELIGDAEYSAATTCAARLEQYPVHGKHNGGWDPNALTYSCPSHPQNAKDNSDFIKGDHYGNDIFGARGTPIVAARAGKVVSAKTTSIGGKNVTIRDACGWYYYYAHLNSIDTAVGRTVAAGTKIGTLGNTGNASGTSPHLHFSIYPDGSYNRGVDPFPHLQKVDATACK